VFVRPSRRLPRFTSGPSVAGCPVATFRPKGRSRACRAATDRVTANAASSSELRLYRYCPSPAGRGSNHRPRRPDPAFAYPLACPHWQCVRVSRHIKPDHTRATIAPGVYARDLGSKVGVISLGGSPSRPARRRPGPGLPVCVQGVDRASKNMGPSAAGRVGALGGSQETVTGCQGRRPAPPWRR
jgi:hypothetical protein